MNEFVLFNKPIIISDELAEHIYSYLSIDEKTEIDNIIYSGLNVNLSYVIEALYCRLSNRKRMNPRFVQAIKDYKAKHKKFDIARIENIKKDLFVINIDDNEKETIEYEFDMYCEPEELSSWKNGITYAEEVENIPETISVNELFESNNTKKISIKRIKNKIVRKFLKIKSKEIRIFEKEINEQKGNKYGSASRISKKNKI